MESKEQASKFIDEFMRCMREYSEAYKMAVEDLSQADLATEDILHAVELDSMEDIVDDALITKLSKIRKERRAAKDKLQTLKPIHDFVEKNASTMGELQRLLGEVRKCESYQVNRRYKPRTDVVESLRWNLSEMV